MQKFELLQDYFGFYKLMYRTYFFETRNKIQILHFLNLIFLSQMRTCLSLGKIVSYFHLATFLNIDKKLKKKENIFKEVISVTNTKLAIKST